MAKDILWLLWLFAAGVYCWPYDPEQLDYNLNTNEAAQSPLEYSGKWEGHNYTASPKNWRFPFYTLFLDRFVNGDPRNDDINGTVFENDVMSTSFRYGGDLAGLHGSLDYLQGLGVRGLYIAGTPYLNRPWKYDQYSPLDLSILDHHSGTIKEWQDLVDEIHSRGMYIMLDLTGSTMADLIGVEQFLNETAPFSPKGYDVIWKDPARNYSDFTFNNDYKDTCEYPRFWNVSGERVLKDSTETVDAEFPQLVGCYDSEFDQYGDTEAFGIFADWQRQLTKFASVQDRLREWLPSVREKISVFNCLLISQLDIDGVRFDKATQMTPDALAAMSAEMRTCALKYGKENFFISGEIAGGDRFGSIFLGRGREFHTYPEKTPTNYSNSSLFLRNESLQGLDAAAFHYSIRRTLTRLLGLDGPHLENGYDLPTDLVNSWNTMLISNDFINANTGEVDPRHMYGVTNQDVFRWPAISNGTDRMLLGLFLTSLVLPGIPLLLWGEEQSLYLLADTSAANYIFGRQPMSSNIAWQTHGCFSLDTSTSDFYQLPLDAALKGCEDELVGLDHRDPTHPVYNVIKAMYALREAYPVLNDGLDLQALSKQTHEVQLPGSGGTATETGLWSVSRSQSPDIQVLDSGNQSVWLVYHNQDRAVTYKFDCTKNETALIAPFAEGTTVRNLFAPYEELELQNGPKIKHFIDKSEEYNGCLEEIKLDAWGFKAFVPRGAWKKPGSTLTGFLPGHDARLKSALTVEVELRFSAKMDCDDITDSITISSTTEGKKTPKIDTGSVACSSIDVPTYGSYVPSVWSWKAKLSDVKDGVHSLSLTTASTTAVGQDTIDHLMFRTGHTDNPLVFPNTANYSASALTKDPHSHQLIASHSASGADLWRYSTNFGSSWSPWETYEGGNSTIEGLPWNGTSRQKWSGDHIMLQYWSKLAGSSAHIQHADADWSDKPPRWFPNLYAQGPYNQFGFDAGLPTRLHQESRDGLSKFHLMTEWPTVLSLNVWGMNPDGKPDQSFVYGDANNDSVLDRIIPEALAPTVLNLSVLPPSPYLAYQLSLHQGSLRYAFTPVGSRTIQILTFSLLWVLPVLSATLGIFIYMGAFYRIKFNQTGISKTAMSGVFGMFRNRRRGFNPLDDQDQEQDIKMGAIHSRSASGSSAGGLVEKVRRRCVLIATMEYDIEDWEIKIKIGGLGVMAQLMGKALVEQDLVWVVPCVSGIDYPIDRPEESMIVTVLDQQYEVKVQTHQLRNITYVLLDAPVFRQQTKAEPYPPRMDDLDSAIYYSAWNACIAETMKRFPIDIYHINDYHGAAAPLYLLPQTIPCCLSLHNAEFQGLWPIRTKEEQAEVCKTFNLDVETVEKYIQFGEVFNLLHAGASYLRVHQKGFGAVGVSNKYGPRSYARYPIFWGLKEIGKLPNPDPSDTEPWNRELDEATNKVVTVDHIYEASRGALREQAQQWAGLIVDPTAELFVFVGRWSVQKGVDLIADVFPAVLDKHKNVQLICIGPVIDLHGKFAALKLEQIMKAYPGRVFSKPEFTQLPPYLFSGAEFALIPSRDEPFGLVAVEFGRKGALGVGARVGGLGQMPGWWFTVESNTTKHMINQFKSAIEDAIGSNTSVRAAMRARSAKQRFPVAQWVEDLEILQSAAIRIHKSEKRTSRRRSPSPQIFAARGGQSDRLSAYEEDPVSSFEEARAVGGGLDRTLTLGTRAGPGHRSGTGGQEPDYWTEVEQQAEVSISQEDAEAAFRSDEVRHTLSRLEGRPDRPRAFPRLHTDDYSRGRSGAVTPRISVELPTAVEARPFDFTLASSRSRSPSPSIGTQLLPSQAVSSRRHMSSTSLLSLGEVTRGRHDFNLQKIELNFTDAEGQYYNKFQTMLEKDLNAKTSEGSLIIEDFLKESEKEWAARYRDAKLGRSKSPGRKRDSGSSMLSHRDSSSDGETAYTGTGMNEFLLHADYVKPSMVKRIMRTRIFDWPIYSFFLAIGQIIAANSYQIVLLTGGSSGDEEEKLYVVGGIYIVASCLWWALYRKMTPRWVLSVPFLLYGMTFIVVGLAPFIHSGGGRDWARNVATGLYAAASASGSLYFALNFGDEGGSPIESWIYRACLVQGIQQIYIAALFLWSQTMSEGASAGQTPQSMIANKPIMAAIACPIGAVLLSIGALLFTSLPPYYRQTPGKIPNFYQSLLRRKLIIWMLISVILSNYWLSAPYGRSWSYLWSSQHTPKWAIAILAAVFFVGIWVAMLLAFAQFSKSHSWFLPMFAFGLLAPRWAQMWWGTSSYGLWLPWMPGGPVGGAIAGRSLWLWLGVLDSIQGIGVGMALLQTLTRIHVAITLTACQILGAAVTMIAKASSPNKDGPGLVFPDLSAGVVAGLAQPWFWVALVCQLIIPVGFFIFFRKEQLTKP